MLLAHCVLENLVIECSPVTETLEVPQTAFGRIIGTFDDIVSVISMQSGGIQFLDTCAFVIHCIGLIIK